MFMRYLLLFVFLMYNIFQGFADKTDHTDQADDDDDYGDYFQFHQSYDDGDEKIIDGFEANLKQFYYQVSIRLSDKHYCGGAIISNRFILTAAHCTRLHVDHPRRLSIQAGTTNVGSAEGQIVQVATIYQHPLFNATSLDYDMALLELDDELEFTDQQRPIRVTRITKFPLDAVAAVSGWGYTTEGGAMAKTLQAVQVPLIPRLNCREFYPRALTPRMICAGYLLGGKDACQGDSGGPLVYNRQLVGIVSWGKGCARPKRPGVYTNISLLRSFITKYAGIP